MLRFDDIQNTKYIHQWPFRMANQVSITPNVVIHQLPAIPYNYLTRIYLARDKSTVYLRYAAINTLADLWVLS